MSKIVGSLYQFDLDGTGKVLVRFQEYKNGRGIYVGTVESGPDRGMTFRATLDEVRGARVIEEAPPPGEPTYFEKTTAGCQGVLIHMQRTQENLGAIRSDILLSEQTKGTMFEPESPKEPTLFDENADAR